MPQKINRLGKFIPSRNNLIEVCFESKQTAKFLLLNKNTVERDNIYIIYSMYSDQTPNQRKYAQNLIHVLHERTPKGEMEIY